MSTCKGCGAPIVWKHTPKGKAIPLDAKPERRLVLRGPLSETAELVETYTSHFSTCPKADDFRKPKEPHS